MAGKIDYPGTRVLGIMLRYELMSGSCRRCGRYLPLVRFEAETDEQSVERRWRRGWYLCEGCGGARQRLEDVVMARLDELTQEGE